jgi:hypothetical protein
LDDDLAAALSAALVSAPAADAVAPVVPAAPAPPLAPPTRSAAGVAGTLREFRRDAGEPADRTAAEAQPAPGAAAGVVATAPAAALPGAPWRREDDDILPSGGGRSGRARHRGRR